MLSQALWVVVGLDASGLVVSNGTAAYVDGLGFVTNDHVIQSQAGDGSVRHVLIRTDAPQDMHDFTVRASDRHLDIAVLESQSAPVTAALRAREGIGARMEEEILLAGFPNWMPGHLPRVEKGRVAQLRTVSARRLAQITCSIHGGNSGGPVFGTDGRVVAIATYDGSSLVLPNGAVDIQHAFALI